MKSLIHTKPDEIVNSQPAVQAPMLRGFEGVLHALGRAEGLAQALRADVADLRRAIEVRP